MKLEQCIGCKAYRRPGEFWMTPIGSRCAQCRAVKQAEAV